MKKPTYVVDTNSLIDAWRWYPQNHFPALWESVEHLIETERLRSPSRVWEELGAGTDDLKNWAKQHKVMFVDETIEQQKLMRELLRTFPMAASAPGRGANYADPWVVVLAKSLNSVVVSEEKGKGGSAVRIPQMCKHWALPHSRIVGLFASENWTFDQRR